MKTLCRHIRRLACVVALLACAAAGAAVGAQSAPRPGTGWLQPGGHISLRVPVRVLLAGDSLMEGLGPQMKDALSGYGNLTFIPIGKKSTGLSRRDFYDWPTVLKQHLAAHKPHLVVMWVGTNDAQSIYGRPDAGEPCSREWQLAYLEKIREIFMLVRQHRARLILMGPPVVGKPQLNEQLGVIHRLMEWACGRAGVCYVNTRAILGDASGRFTMQGYVPGGRAAVLRTPDRLHITADGNRRVMAYLLPYISEEISRCFQRTSAPRATYRRSSATISGRSAEPQPRSRQTR